MTEPALFPEITRTPLVGTTPRVSDPREFVDAASTTGENLLTAQQPALGAITPDHTRLAGPSGRTVVAAEPRGSGRPARNSPARAATRAPSAAPADLDRERLARRHRNGAPRVAAWPTRSATVASGTSSAPSAPSATTRAKRVATTPASSTRTAAGPSATARTPAPRVDDNGCDAPGHRERELAGAVVALPARRLRLRSGSAEQHTATAQCDTRSHRTLDDGPLHTLHESLAFPGPRRCPLDDQAQGKGRHRAIQRSRTVSHTISGTSARRPWIRERPAPVAGSWPAFTPDPAAVAEC